MLRILPRLSKPFFAMAAGLLTCVLALAAGSSAAPGPATERLNAHDVELVVFEVPGCLYCRLLRRDVASDYLRSPRAKSVPMRFVDARAADMAAFGLTAPLTTVPTVVLMRNGREMGRIAGYTGREPFFHLISALLRR